MDDFATEQDKYLLTSAQSIDSEKMIDQIRQFGANLNANYPKGFTPLMAAAKHGHSNALRALLCNGANTTRWIQTTEVPLRLPQTGTINLRPAFFLNSGQIPTPVSFMATLLAPTPLPQKRMGQKLQIQQLA